MLGTLVGGGQCLPLRSQRWPVSQHLAECSPRHSASRPLRVHRRLLTKPPSFVHRLLPAQSLARLLWAAAPLQSSDSGSPSDANSVHNETILQSPHAPQRSQILKHKCRESPREVLSFLTHGLTDHSILLLVLSRLPRLCPSSNFLCGTTGVHSWLELLRAPFPSFIHPDLAPGARTEEQLVASGVSMSVF